jgi:CheY-like chemotaxis protein
VRLSENILIVEDEDEWRGVYSRAVDSRGSSRRIMVAEDLAAAKRLILAARFAVAFVDVGLDASDDQNVDGLQVMRWLRDTGDGTSIIVVTGRSGQDALRIGRDAIKEYGAFDTVGKSTVTPAQLRNLLDGGLEAFRDSQEKRDGKAGGTAARDALRGQPADPAGSQVWDLQVMEATGFKGSVDRFYQFLGDLLGSYLPVVGRRPGEPAVVDASAGLVHGDYWSRAQAGGIVVCFGQAAAVDRALLERGRDGLLLGQYSAGESAEELTAADGAVKGVVLLLRESQREDFRGESGRLTDRSASGLSG